MNMTATTVALEGYLQRERSLGTHPAEAMAIPFTLAEWEGILKALQSVRPEEAVAIPPNSVVIGKELLEDYMRDASLLHWVFHHYSRFKPGWTTYGAWVKKLVADKTSALVREPQKESS